jgi:hypothetical protein
MRGACIAGGLALCLTACHQEARQLEASALTVDTVPITVVRATGPDGAVRFGEATAGIRLSDGTVVLIDNSDLTLRVFDSTGRSLAPIGRKGKGPGEFQDISVLARCGGDSIFVFDNTLERLTVFRPNGALARTTPIPLLAMETCGPSGLTLAVGPSLDLFMPTVQNAGELYHVPVQLIRGTDTTSLYDSLPAADPRFGGRMPAFAIAGSRAVVGLTDSAFATVFDATGQEVTSIRISDDPQPGSREAQVKVLDRVFSSPRYRALADQKARFLKMPYPDPQPAYFTLMGTPNGTIWTLITGPEDSVTHLRATDSLGTSLGDLTLPFPLTIFEVGDDYILGRRENEIGEQRVVVYRIGRMGEMGGMGG